MASSKEDEPSSCSLSRRCLRVAFEIVREQHHRTLLCLERGSHRPSAQHVEKHPQHMHPFDLRHGPTANACVTFWLCPNSGMGLLVSYKGVQAQGGGGDPYFPGGGDGWMDGWGAAPSQMEIHGGDGWRDTFQRDGRKAELGHWRRARECKPQASRRMQREQRTLCSSAPSRRHRIQDHGTRIVTPGVPFFRNGAGCPPAKKKTNITDTRQAKRTCAFINCLPVPSCNSLPNGTWQSTMPQLLGVSGASFPREHGCRRCAQGGAYGWHGGDLLPCTL